MLESDLGGRNINQLEENDRDDNRLSDNSGLCLLNLLCESNVRLAKSAQPGAAGDERKDDITTQSSAANQAVLSFRFATMLASGIELAGKGFPPANSFEFVSADTPKEEEAPKTDDTARFKELKAKKDVDGLKEFALSVKNKSLAGQAVDVIKDTAPDGGMDILRVIARSDSMAATSAMRALAVHSKDRKDVEIIDDRVKNGDIFRMWREGKLDTRDILETLTYTKNADETIARAIKEFADRPDLKLEICRALVQTDPMLSSKSRVFFDIGNVSPETRKKAIDELIAAKDPHVGESLKHISEDKTAGGKELAEFARQRLTTLWTSDVKPQPGQAAPSELLNGPKLKDAVAEAGKTRWTDIPNIAEKYKEWETAVKKAKLNGQALREDICNKLNPVNADPESDIYEKLLDNWHDEKVMEDLLKGEAGLLAEYRAARLEEKRIDNMRSEIDKILEAREAALKPHLEKICKDLGIPVPELKSISAANAGKTYGLYYPGYGQIKLNELLLLTAGDSPSPKLIGTLLHELVHAEQDTLIMRRLADKLKIDKDATPEQKQKLKEEYLRERAGKTAPTDSAILSEKAKKAIQDSWLDDVLKNRDGKPLTEQQAKRADTLLKGYAEKAEFQANKKALDTLCQKLEKNLKLAKDYPLAITFGGDRNGRMDRAKGILEVAELPPPLAKALQDYNDAEREKKPPEEMARLEAALRSEWTETLQRRIIKVGREAHKIYVERAHEVESHEVGRRSEFFASAIEAGEGTNSQNKVVSPTHAVDLNINRAFKIPATLNSFADLIAARQKELKARGEDAGVVLRDLVLDFCERNQIKDARLNEKCLDFDFSETVKEPTLQFYGTSKDAENEQLSIKDGKYVDKLGKEVKPEDVRTVVLIPKNMLTADAKALAGVIYQACIRQTGQLNASQADLAGERALVNTLLKQHIPVLEPGLQTITGSDGVGLDTSHTPGTVKNTIIEAATDLGLKITTPDGKEQIYKYAELVKLDIEQIEKDLAKEEAKGTEANQAEIQRLKTALEQSRKNYEALSNPSHEHNKTVTEKMKSAFDTVIKSAGAKSPANEHGATSSRSRLVFLSQLARLALIP